MHQDILTLSLFCIQALQQGQSRPASQWPSSLRLPMFASMLRPRQGPLLFQRQMMLEMMAGLWGPALFSIGLVE